ncbi:MAG TPA: DNA polymerase III subunit gamma/tau [Candidatus Margulisiibacteriota bacterium]|nr:DNA polymerase III subunit gamma/tau [Candidatus Margulisiibacteriota bacterium]
MSYLVLARKWRPQDFNEIVGQEHVSQTLMNAIRSNRVAHAFLFTGVRGVGKTTAARVLAKALNCANGPTPTPCNTCVNCQEITAGTAVDVLEIDGASNTGVDDVREIIENVRYQPAKSRFKIYIIDEVHMLSTSAFNALLKTLEEPPPHVKFIFATTDPHKVPHTIHSRCQRYDFKRIPFRLIADRLLHIARSEGIEVSEHALFLIAREGEGSMRDAQSLLDQVIAFAGKTVRDADVVAALGLADRKLLYAVAEAIVDRNPVRALELLNELHLYGHDLRRFARELLEHFRNLSVARVLPSAELLPDLPDEERAEVQRQAQKMSSEDLDRAFRLMLATESEVSRVPYPKLIMEMALIKLATLTPVVAVEQLLERLDALDNRLGGTGNGAAGPGGPTTAGAKSPTPARPQPPVRSQRTAPAEDAATASAAGPQPAGDRTWEGFVAFVAKEKVTLLPYVSHSQMPRLDEPVLTLNVPRGYYYDYLAQRDHTQLVEELARRFFARDLRVTVNAIDVEDNNGAAAESAESPAALHAAALDNPAVRAAVEILGGQVQEVKARPRRGRETA